MFEGFKKFIFRGNVIDLSVGVVIGAAFNNIVQAFVKDILTPLLAVPGKTPDFSAWSFTINDSKFMVGDFINATISFLIIAAVIYFLIIKPVNKVKSLYEDKKVVDKKTCPKCLSKIPVGAKKCAYCTSELIK